MIIRCRECGKEISEQAAVCPHCGITLLEKCPNCGELGYKQDGDRKVCIKCGHDSRGYTLFGWIKIIILYAILIPFAIWLANRLMS